MSEIKSALDEGRKACEELFDRDYFGNHNVEMSELSAIWDRFDKAGVSYEALLSELRSLEQQLDVAREFCRQLQIENEKLKAATTECYEKNLDLNLENFELKSKNAQLVIENNHLQFLLDSVMLEYCPNEMTEEQMKNWSKHQRKVDTSSLEYYKSDTYKNNIKFSVDMIK